MSDMKSFRITVNRSLVTVSADPDTPLLWVLRDDLGLVGTKYGCGVAQCGACTVHVDGRPTRSCSMPIQAVGAGHVTTIEGLHPDGDHPMQQAWRSEDVAQCGYCQAGQIMAAAALLSRVPEPTDRDIDEALAGNLCRCGTYLRIRAAVKRAAKLAAAGKLT